MAGDLREALVRIVIVIVIVIVIGGLKSTGLTKTTYSAYDKGPTCTVGTPTIRGLSTLRDA